LTACETGGGGIPAAVPPEATPRFGPGDKFEVTVFEEEELSGEFQVQEDGSIDYPLIQRIEVSGLTQSELQKKLEELLRDGYLVNPQVRVNIVERQNLEVSVLGWVSKPGTFPYVENLTLVQAISDAGGLKELANSRKVRLTRKTGEGTETFEISLKEITKGKRRDELLQPGDIVFVPESPI
jgi:polysaccharide export outer membrane protein